MYQLSEDVYQWGVHNIPLHFCGVVILKYRAKYKGMYSISRIYPRRRGSTLAAIQLMLGRVPEKPSSGTYSVQI